MRTVYSLFSAGVDLFLGTSRGPPGVGVLLRCMLVAFVMCGWFGTRIHRALRPHTPYSLFLQLSVSNFRVVATAPTIMFEGIY